MLTYNGYDDERRQLRACAERGIYRYNRALVFCYVERQKDGTDIWMLLIKNICACDFLIYWSMLHLTFASKLFHWTTKLSKEEKYPPIYRAKVLWVHYYFSWSNWFWVKWILSNRSFQSCKSSSIPVSCRHVIFSLLEKREWEVLATLWQVWSLMLEFILWDSVLLSHVI